MRKYFEYALPENRPNLDLYSSEGLEQHSPVQRRKTALKLTRILRRVSFRKTDTVLDFGCGPGYMLGLMAGMIDKGVGVDVSAAALSHAPRLPNIEFRLAEPAGGAQFHEEFFDKVLLMDVLEHVVQPGQVIRQCLHTLKADGELVVQVPFTGFLSELVTGRFHEGHLRYYDPDYLQQWLTKEGCLVQSVDVYNSVPLNKWWLRAQPAFWLANTLCNAIPSRWFPWFGEILAVCGKGGV